MCHHLIQEHLVLHILMAAKGSSSLQWSKAAEEFPSLLKWILSFSGSGGAGAGPDKAQRHLSASGILWSCESFDTKYRPKCKSIPIHSTALEGTDNTEPKSLIPVTDEIAQKKRMSSDAFSKGTVLRHCSDKQSVDTQVEFSRCAFVNKLWSEHCYEN